MRKRIKKYFDTFCIVVIIIFFVIPFMIAVAKKVTLPDEEFQLKKKHVRDFTEFVATKGKHWAQKALK